MNKNDIIKEAYEAFSDYKRPNKFTLDHGDPETIDHSKTLNDCDLDSFNKKHIGHIGWSPLSFLTGESLAYLMPKLIEYALNLENNDEEDLFLPMFLMIISPEEKNHLFSNYSESHKKIIIKTLNFIKEKYNKEVQNEFCEEDLELAIKFWSDL